jgi:hypothetical protein
MRKAFVIAFAVLSFTSALFAKGKHDWEHVEKLKSGTPVLISLWSGRLISGSVEAVGPDAVRIDTAGPDVGVGSLIEFGRTDVRRIVRVRRPNLPDPARWMAMGALIGGGVGFTSGAIYDVAHHENYHWLAGGFSGAVFGFLGSCAILAGVGTVDLFHHHDKLVYEDQRTGKMLATDWQCFR